jgi:hypothetical protein
MTDRTGTALRWLALHVWPAVPSERREHTSVKHTVRHAPPDLRSKHYNMPVFFGLENTKGLKVSEQLQAKGYGDQTRYFQRYSHLFIFGFLSLNYLRAAPSQIRIFSIPSRIQYLFRTYVQFLPAFMHATYVQTKTDLSVHGYPIQFDLANGIPSVSPHVAVIPRIAVPSATMDWFKENARMTEEKYKGRNIMIFQTPTREVLERIRALNPDPVTPAPENTVNPSCLPVLTLVNKIISLFCKTHYYPAFQDDDHMEHVGGPRFDDVQTARKRTRATTPGPTTRSKKTKGATTITTVDEDEHMNTDDGEDGEERPSGAGSKHAVPSPRTITGWGGSTDVPELPGIFFQFELDLCAPDTETVPDIIEKYFIGCLGRDVHQIATTMAMVREKYGVLGRTDAGKVTSHMMKVLGICLEGQARFFPVFDGQVYVGSVMCGAGYRVINQGKVLEPYSHEKIQSELEECGAGKSIYKAIGVLANARDDDENTWSTGEVGFSTMKGLADVMKYWTLTEAMRDEIIKLASRLTFPVDKWPVNPSTISRALDLIASPDELPAELPIHYTKLFTNDRVAVVWSCFGLLAPTTNFRSGKTIKLEGGRIDSTITFTQVGLDEAIADLKRNLHNKTVVVPQQQRRSGPYKDFKFTSVDAQKIWESLRGAAGVELGDNGATGGRGEREAIQAGVLEDWY